MPGCVSTNLFFSSGRHFYLSPLAVQKLGYYATFPHDVCWGTGTPLQWCLMGIGTPLPWCFLGSEPPLQWCLMGIGIPHFHGACWGPVPLFPMVLVGDRNPASHGNCIYDGRGYGTTQTLITSADEVAEVLCYPASVCLFVCLSVCLLISRISQQVIDGFEIIFL